MRRAVESVPRHSLASDFLPTGQPLSRSRGFETFGTTVCSPGGAEQGWHAAYEPEKDACEDCEVQLWTMNVRWGDPSEDTQDKPEHIDLTRANRVRCRCVELRTNCVEERTPTSSPPPADVFVFIRRLPGNSNNSKRPFVRGGRAFHRVGPAPTAPSRCRLGFMATGGHPVSRWRIRFSIILPHFSASNRRSHRPEPVWKF